MDPARRRSPSASSTVRSTSRKEEVRARIRSNLHGRAEQHQADGRSEVPPRPAVPTTSSRGSSSRPPRGARDALAEGSRPQARREVDGPAPGQRAAGGRRRPRRREEARRSPPHGRGQQGVRALPLDHAGGPCQSGRPSGRLPYQPWLFPPGGPSADFWSKPWPAKPHRALPQHRYLGAHRRRQDHDDRAHPVTTPA